MAVRARPQLFMMIGMARSSSPTSWRCRRRRQCIPALLLATLSLPPTSLASPRTQEPQAALDSIRQYISSAWDVLTRSLDQCSTVADPKIATEPASGVGSAPGRGTALSRVLGVLRANRQTQPPNAFSARSGEREPPALSSRSIGMQVECLTGNHVNSFLIDTVAVMSAQFDCVFARPERKGLELFDCSTVSIVNVYRSILHLGDDLDLAGVRCRGVVAVIAGAPTPVITPIWPRTPPTGSPTPATPAPAATDYHMMWPSGRLRSQEEERQ